MVGVDGVISQQESGRRHDAFPHVYDHEQSTPDGHDKKDLMQEYSYNKQHQYEKMTQKEEKPQMPMGGNPGMGGMM